MLTKKWYVFAPALSMIFAGARTQHPSEKAACTIAMEWVFSHQAQLPTTYDAFAKFPTVYQKAIYPRLTAEVREALWRTHLSSYLQPSRHLTDEQSQFVNTAIERLPVYVDGQNSPEALFGARVTERAEALFGKDLAAEMFFSLVVDARDLSTAGDPPPCDCYEFHPCGGEVGCKYDHCTGHYCGFFEFCTGRCS